MRILITEPRLAGAATASLTTELAEQLQLRGHVVDVLPRTRASFTGVLRAARQADLLLPVDGPLAGAWCARWLLGKPYKPILSEIRVQRFRRIPVVPWMLWLMRRSARRILTLNSATRNALVREGVPRKSLELLPPPVALGEPAVPPSADRPRLAAELLECAPLTTSALFRILDNVMEEFPNAELLLSGAPGAVAAAEERVRTLGLEAHVRFCGETAGLLRSGAVALAVGAEKERINFQFALRAAGAGMPVVAMRAAALEDWLKDGETALLAGSGDERAVVGAVAGLFQRPEQAEKLSEAARARMEARHTWDGFLEALLGTSG